MTKPITYYAQTPAIDAFCHKYGSYWQGLTNLERMAIASGISQHLLATESDALNSLLVDSSILHLTTWEGFEFEDHAEVVRLLGQLDIELDSSMAANLLVGIYSNMTF